MTSEKLFLNDFIVFYIHFHSFTFNFYILFIWKHVMKYDEMQLVLTNTKKN